MEYNNFKMRKDFILEETMSTFGLSSKYKFVDVKKISYLCKASQPFIADAITLSIS